MQDSNNKILHVGILLNKFKKGQERYHTDPVFNRVVIALAGGTDPITIIDDLCGWLKELGDKYEDYVKKGPPPQYIITDAETIERIKNDPDFNLSKL